MINMDLLQGSPAWHRHRKAHYNASDASAMMGLSPYTTRSELIHRLATGIEKDVTPSMQAIFNRGHELEAQARPWAEKIINAKLYADVGTLEIDGLQLSASFDGLTEARDIIWECKTWSKANRESVALGKVPLHIRPQIEQQLLISEADMCMFMISDGEESGAMHCSYSSDPQLRADLIAGWQQLKKDVAAYKPGDVVIKATGKVPQSLPALRIEVQGMVTSSNLADFKSNALAVIGAIKRDLTTDEDFADAAVTVKWCGDVETRLAAAKQHALSQTASIDELFRTIDEISAEARRVRLDLDKLVTARKAAIKQGIIIAAQDALNKHISDCMSALSRPFAPCVTSEFAGVTRGKSSLSGMQDAVDTELARCKIDADAKCRVIKLNLTWFESLAESNAMKYLFDDLDIIVTKPYQDFSLIVSQRIVKHKSELLVESYKPPFALADLVIQTEKSAPGVSQAGINNIPLQRDQERSIIYRCISGMDVKQLKRVSAFCLMVQGKVAA